MIPLVDLVAQYNSIKPEIDAAIQNVLTSGKFILGPQEKAFEQEIAEYLGVKHAIGVASGTDALIIALRAIGVGPNDEVIVPAYSFFATAGAVLSVGAKPVFVDIHPDTYNIDAALIEDVITKQTKAIIPVHLYGLPADMDEILAIAQKHNLMVIEDNAQAFGAKYKGKHTGAIGDLGCLSFFPSKNLGGYGDGGMVTTNDDNLAELVRMLRTHGWKKKYFPEILGYNSRLDEIQAAILRVKLKYVDQWNKARWEIAQIYSRSINGIEITTPSEIINRSHVYHLYVICLKNRNEYISFLKNKGITTEIYYPQPLFLAKPCLIENNIIREFPITSRVTHESLALPLYPEIPANRIIDVINAINGCLGTKKLLIE
ncbi:MAG: transcriptional regulator [Chloroflexi bacterium 44-23]|nr:MAG: transcriptional regulator [Chloroflexi bacterium 44-23]